MTYLRIYSRGDNYKLYISDTCHDFIGYTLHIKKLIDYRMKNIVTIILDNLCFENNDIYSTNNEQLIQMLISICDVPAIDRRNLYGQLDID